MGVKNQKKFLTVAPFECAWREELRFKEAGRGCVTFEASAQNDVTVVFREQLGSQRYHYKMDNSPNYTVILGSHRNRRLKIEVNGRTVVDVAGVGLCCSSAFQSYWISIYDGLISIGNGKYPFQNLVFQWLDSQPNCNVQYVGLSSWDKHVGYRNVNVLPLTQHKISLWKHIDYQKYEGDIDEDQDLEDLAIDCENWGLMSFLENWDLSDVLFLVGLEKRAVPGHMVILSTFGDFLSKLITENTIELPSTSYFTLHALLEYIYTGQTQIAESHLRLLFDLSIEFHVSSLIQQCEDIIEQLENDKKLFDSGNKVEIKNKSKQSQQFGIFPCEVPVDVSRLKMSLATGKHSDVNIYVEEHGLIAQAHKLILSLWSPPFTKMFTNGMVESRSSDVVIRDVPVEAFKAMLQFMYSGELELNKDDDMLSLLIPILLLADQFHILYLQRECCKCLLECLTEDSVCVILQAVSSMPSCKLLEDECKRNFSMHFDYCTTASTSFVLLEESTFMDILKHGDVTVTSEEKILDAILVWCMQAHQLFCWSAIDELLALTTPEQLFKDRLPSVDILLPYVRFPLMPKSLLQKLGQSRLSCHFPVFEQLVKEAIKHLGLGLPAPGINQSIRFQHRRSSYRELQYICDGDRNGVLYFAGTSYGEHPWVNPVLAKKITVTASSPRSRYTDPKALVSRMYQGTSFAGSRTVDSRNCSWWMVDIGQDHQLMCNYYTLRQDGSTTFIRSWALQGSIDGENWEDLIAHEDDRTICRPGQFSSWPIQGPASLLPFRFFRVILTGPTTNQSNAWNFCICFIELYGYFR